MLQGIGNPYQCFEIYHPWILIIIGNISRDIFRRRDIQHRISHIPGPLYKISILNRENLFSNYGDTIIHRAARQNVLTHQTTFIQRAQRISQFSAAINNDPILSVIRKQNVQIN